MDYHMMDTTIYSLGEAKIDSPMTRMEGDNLSKSFISENERVLLSVNPDELKEKMAKGETPVSFELAGPRKQIYFDPSKLRCALVTCGGLCPGLNDIIRSIVLELHYRYGVKNIYGIQYGLQGFIPEYGHDVVDLGPADVASIYERGGTILGSSRGPQDIDKVVDCLERMNIGILFMIGGDGTQRAALTIADAVLERGLKIAVVGVPKTIDNDIFLVAKSFGFDTAVDVATQAIEGAHNEAEGYHNGIGLIKLMGRHSGFLAATAALAKQDVNFVLIPEVEFDLEGPTGLLVSLEKRLVNRRHAVIVVAEGAGQNLFKGKKDTFDASGNVKLHDIGVFLKEKIGDYFKSRKMEISLKYIDPSYMIRSLPPNSNDHVFCSFLGRDAVHAGMSGKTKVLIGHWNNHYVHIPMELSVGKRKQVSPYGKLWLAVLEATGQGPLRNGKQPKL